MGPGGEFPLPVRTLLLAARPRGRGPPADRLALLAERIGRPSVLLTTDDVGAIFLAEHGHDLRRWFLFRIRPPTCRAASRTFPTLRAGIA